MKKLFASKNFASSQSGIGLPAAIFIITTMALIAVAINLLVRENAETFVEEINLSRAFYAAESGAGFIMNRTFPLKNTLLTAVAIARRALTLLVMTFLAWRSAQQR